MVGGVKIALVRADRPAEVAGERLARAIAAADAIRGRCRLAIPGGSALAALPCARKHMSEETWSRVQLTWVDERCVPVESPDSNRGAWRRLGLPAVGGELPLWADEDDEPAQAVARFEREFARRFAGGLDVALLGLGEDGHVASLFPGHAALAATGAAVFVPDSPKPPARRISLTLAVLQRTATSILLVTGAGKRPALARVLARAPELPTSALGDLVIATELDTEARRDA